MCVYLNFLAHISDFQTDLREPSNNKKHFQKKFTKLDFCHHATAPAPYASLEDDLNGRKHKRKIISMEDEFPGR